MGDMADDFLAMKAATKMRRADRMASANDAGWSKLSEYHWYRIINGQKLNYWPSSALVMIGTKKHNIRSKHIRRLLSQGAQGNERTDC